MNILFDIGHPAHVHLFRNFITYLQKEKHTVVVTTRDKEITNTLLNHYGIPYTTLSKPSSSILGMMTELLQRDWGIYKLHLKHQFDFAYGTSVSIGHLSAVSKVQSFNFNEDDDDIVPLYANISYPFCTKIINPTCIRYTKWREKTDSH